MTTSFYLLWGGLLAGSIIVALVSSSFLDFYNDWPMLPMFLGIIGAIVCIVIISVNSLSYHFDKINCYKFGANSERTVKFVKYTNWSWDCLTPQKNGHWIPIDQLRSVGGDN